MFVNMITCLASFGAGIVLIAFIKDNSRIADVVLYGAILLGVISSIIYLSYSVILFSIEGYIEHSLVVLSILLFILGVVTGLYLSKKLVVKEE